MNLGDGIYFWVNEEKAHMGYSVQISRDRIIFSGYSLPATKYSGGGQSDFLFDEYYSGSTGYELVKTHFSEELAEHILKLILDRGNLPHVKRFNEETALLEKWLSDKKEVDLLSSIRSKLPYGRWYYPYDEEFSKLPIKRIVSPDENSAEFYDKEYGVLLYNGHRNSQVQYQEKKGFWRAFLIAEREVVIIHEILGEVVVTRPLEELSDLIRNTSAEINLMLRADDLLIFDFDRVRGQNKYGTYVIALNPSSGKIVYQKTN